MPTATATATAPARTLTAVPLLRDPLPPIDPARPPWPGAVEQAGGVRLHVRRTPGPAAGEPVVFLHGLGGSASNFTDVAALLATRSPGLALDLPGFGRSEPPAGFDHSMTAHADTVSAFLDGLGADGALGGPVHLVGNSMGGTVALLLAELRPDLVRTLTLVSPAMPDLRVDVRRVSDPRIALSFLPLVGARFRAAVAGAGPDERAERMLRLCFADPSAVPDVRRAAAVTEFAERAELPWAAQALAGATEDLVRRWLVPPSRSLWTLAGRVDRPALVVWGDRDRVVDVRKAPRTAAALPRGRLFVLPRTGHVAQMERPTSVARAVLGMVDAVARDAW